MVEQSRSWSTQPRSATRYLSLYIPKRQSCCYVCPAADVVTSLDMLYHRAKTKSGLQTKVKESLETVQRAIRVAFNPAASNSASAEEQEEREPRGSESERAGGPASDNNQRTTEGTTRSRKTKKPTRYQECIIIYEDLIR